MLSAKESIADIFMNFLWHIINFIGDNLMLKHQGKDTKVKRIKQSSLNSFS